MYNYSCTKVIQDYWDHLNQEKQSFSFTLKMAPYKCLFDGCDYQTPDSSEESTLNQHLFAHMQIKHGFVQGSQQNLPTDKTEKLKKPCINMGCSLEDWSFFTSEWHDYKELSKPAESNISRILIQCCETDLRRHLHRSYGNLGEKPEVDVLAIIKKHAVQIENIIVSRVSLLEMKQDRDEPVRNFVSRLKGQASICNYTIKFKPDCGCDKEYDVSYMEEQVRDVLAHGLADNEIRVDILSDASTKTNLDDIVNSIEAKEVGKKSASHLNSTCKINAIRSTYKQEAKQTQRIHHQNQKPDNNFTRSRKTRPKGCTHCGSQGHHKDHESRRKYCPAFNHTCKKCKIRGHYESVCIRKQHESSHLPITSSLYSEYTIEPEEQVGAISQPHETNHR